MRTRTLAVFLLAALAGTDGWCDGGTTVAMVNVERVLTECERSRDIMKELKRQEKDFAAEIGRKLKRMGELEKEFDAAKKESQNRELPDKARREKLEKAEQALMAVKEQEQEIRRYRDDENKRIVGQALKMRKEMVEEIRETVGKYAVSMGIGLVVDSGVAPGSPEGRGPVVYGDAKLDITDEIIRLMNAADPRGKEARE